MKRYTNKNKKYMSSSNLPTIDDYTAFTNGTTTNTTPSKNTNTNKYYGTDLYQQYLDTAKSNVKSKTEQYQNLQASNKYAQDMMRMSGYGGTGLSQSAQAGIYNSYLNAISGLEASQYETDKNIAQQSSSNALASATADLEMGKNTDDIWNTYSQYLSEQDKATLQSDIDYAKEQEEQTLFSSYQTNTSREYYPSSSDLRKVPQNVVNQIDDVLNNESNNGLVTELFGNYVVIYNGKFYKISKEMYNAQVEAGNKLG